MNWCQIITFHSLLVLLCNGTTTEDPIVETKYGILKGKEEYSRFGRGYFAFKGIPYARPPVGKLRFKAPEEPISWTNILSAQEDAPHCLQKTYLFANPKVVGSEDCLYLNVYTPKLRAKRRIIGGLLPVMVFIHWGGFFTGFSSSDYLGPEYFLDRNVILVTFNYRLGVLGFLSTNDDMAPGNYGLKDQVAALKWVQNNIEYFGGDKKKVTIFGQSAGGASVNFHMFSPESKHLFYQGISQSGTSLALWAKPLSKSQILVTKLQAEFVGCQSSENNTSKMVECLRNVKAEDLVESGDRFKYFSIDPLNVFLPSIETKTEKNPNPFLTKQPIEYIRNKEFHNVPWIIGVVHDEGLIRAEPILRQGERRNELNKNFDKLMPNLMALQISSPREDILAVWTKIKDFYFLTENEVNVSDPLSIRTFINLYSDRSFIYSSYQSARFHNMQGHNNIWFYNFNYSGQYSYGNVFAATSENIDYNWGVSHCDDLLYLFKSPALFPDLDNANDKIVIGTMIKLWTNFAIYGDPTPTNMSPAFTDKWLKLDNHLQKNLTKKIHFMNIVGSYRDASPPLFRMKHGFYKSRFKFWEDIPLAENIKELDENYVDVGQL